MLNSSKMDDEEQRDPVNDWWDHVLEIRKRFREEIGDQNLDIEELIRTMREQRSDQLFENVR